MISVDGITLLKCKHMKPVVMDIPVPKNPYIKPRKGLKKRLSRKKVFTPEELEEKTRNAIAKRDEATNKKVAKAAASNEKVKQAQRNQETWQAKDNRIKSEEEALAMKTSEIPRFRPCNFRINENCPTWKV